PPERQTKCGVNESTCPRANLFLRRSSRKLEATGRREANPLIVLETMLPICTHQTPKCPLLRNRWIERRRSRDAFPRGVYAGLAGFRADAWGARDASWSGRPAQARCLLLSRADFRFALRRSPGVSLKGSAPPASGWPHVQ